VNNSICIIDSHANAIEGTELNKSILNTIRASGDAIKRLSVKGGMSTVEDIISEVETQMENASEITKVISAGKRCHLLCNSYWMGAANASVGLNSWHFAGNISGSLNNMGGLDGFSENELDQELDDLLYEEDNLAQVSIDEI
jgi:hypothetical protein